jgi:hypothetical protein
LPLCTEDSCVLCGLTNELVATEYKPYCKRCSNGLIIAYDPSDGNGQGILGGGNGKTGFCTKGMRVKNCYRAPLNDNTKCDVCKRGYYLNKDENECLDLDDTGIDDCIVGHEDKNGWGVICDACLGKMVSPDGKYCLKNFKAVDNCELGGRMGTLDNSLGGYDQELNDYTSRFLVYNDDNVKGEHLPCFLCGQRFYEKNGRCEWSYVQGCKIPDEYNGMCLLCNDFKGFYGTGAYFMQGQLYQTCLFNSHRLSFFYYILAAICVWIAF